MTKFKVLHGNPGNLVAGYIERVTPSLTHKGMIEIQFESGAFTLITDDELADLLDGETINYNERSHGGFSQMVALG